MTSATKAKVDLDDYVSTNSEIEILDPIKNEPTGFKIMLRGMDTPEVRQLLRRMEDQANKLKLRGKFFNAEEIEANSIEITVRAMVGWDWGPTMTWKGETPAFTPALATELLGKKTWIMPQIDNYLGEQKRFYRR